MVRSISRRLSVERVDGTAALRPAEIFQLRNVELGFQLIDSVAVLPGEVQQELDLLRGRGDAGASEVVPFFLP